MKQTMRALLIDDDATLNAVHARLIGHVMQTRKVTTISDPRLVLERFTKPAPQDDQPDMIFVDLEMPHLDGLELIDELEAIYAEYEMDLPLFFMVTSSTYKGDVERIDRNPLIKELVTKPLTFTKVEAIAKKYLPMREEERAKAS